MEGIRTLWADPVWSKVISALILGALSWLGVRLWRIARDAWHRRQQTEADAPARIEPVIHLDPDATNSHIAQVRQVVKWSIDAERVMRCLAIRRDTQKELHIGYISMVTGMPEIEIEHIAQQLEDCGWAVMRNRSMFLLPEGINVAVANKWHEMVPGAVN
jgi:hypothetical protein